MDSSKFHEIYRVESSRLKNWDYLRPGWYFVTICTQNKKWFFGRVKNDEMKLSKIGEIAKKCWEKIPKHFSHVKLREFVVMPNHTHEIIDVENPDYKPRAMIKPYDVNNFRVETLHATSLQKPIKLSTRKQSGDNSKFYSLISPKPNANIPTVIRSYKSAVAKTCHEQNLSFAWQPRFYDHVIRDEYSLYFIEEYIRDNPKNWRKDPLFIDFDWSKVKVELR